MMRPELAVAVVLLTACGTDSEANVAAELGWRFDYADYTSDAPADLRGCDNADDAEVGAVRLVAVDPDGRVQGFDTTYSCAEGVDRRVPIRGIPAGLFDLTALALSGDVVLYRYEESGFDFSGGVARTLTLRAAVGELRFRPAIDGAFECDPEVAQIDVDLFALEDDGPAAEATLSFRTEEPCDGSFFRQIRIGEIPAVPNVGPSGFVLQRYRVQATASSESATLACVTFDRAIPPGSGAAVGGDENLTAAGCP